MPQDTFFRKKKTLNCRGRNLDLSTPVVMGILNMTPDSFYQKSRVADGKDATNLAARMLSEGAGILDLGGQSTRPGAKLLDAGEEWSRLAPLLQTIRREFPDAFLSIDTFYSSVAEKAIGEGVDLINDVSGGALDERMFDTALNLQVPYILMHMQGTPANMQENPHYDDVTTDVLKYFAMRLSQLRAKGLIDVILDPGFGFGKSVEHNFTLLRNLDVFRFFECPVLVGVSRKSMIGKILNIKPEDALNGTTVLHTQALLKGADILRVHDVKEAVEVIKLVKEVISY